MPKAIAAMLGMLLVGHGILCLPASGHLALFNADTATDLLHLAAGLLLLFVSRERAAGRTVRVALLAVAVVFAGLGAIGLGDPALGGFAPSELLVGDFFLLFGVAGAGLLGAVLPRAERPVWYDQVANARALTQPDHASIRA